MSTLCCEVLWRIANISHCWHEQNDSLISQTFTIDSLQKSSWCLYLNPKGQSCFPGNKSSKEICIFLKRLASENGTTEGSLSIVLEFTLLDDKGSLLMYPSHTSFNTFQVGKDFGFSRFIKQSVFKDQPNKCSPGDILNIRCRIFQQYEKLSAEFERVFLETVIPVERFTFVWGISDVEKLTNQSSKVVTIEPTSIIFDNKSFTVTMSYLPAKCDEYLQVKVAGESKVEESVLKCCVYCQQTRELFLSINENLDVLHFKKVFKPIISKDEVSLNPEKYLLNGKLGLNCKFELTVKKVMHLPNKISCLDLEDPSVWSDMIFENRKKTAIISKGSCPSNLMKDITQIYRQGLMCDFIIKVGSHEFKVHSIILAARSKVFQRMLETKMKENLDKILVLDNLEEDVVSQLLDYIYTENVGELNVTMAMQLYCAGHLYDIEGLRELSAVFLMENINTLNVCEILLLSDRYEDQILNKAVIQFIFEHEREVVLCDKFRVLTDNNPQLSAKVFLKISEMRFKFTSE